MSPTTTHHPLNRRDEVRQEAMTAAIIRRAVEGLATTKTDLAAIGFTAAEIARLGDAAVASANRQRARLGLSESWLPQNMVS